MKALYRRVRGHNYILFYGAGNGGGAQTEMIRRNHIPGLAPWFEEWENGQWYWGYDVTGAQPLPRLLEFRTLSLQEAEGFFVSLAKLLGRLDEFLLDWNGLVLEPEYLYCREGAENCLFFFLEGQEGSLESHLKGLTAWFLEKTGENDRALEQLLLRLYRACAGGGLEPEEIFSCLEEPGAYRSGPLQAPELLPEGENQETAPRESLWKRLWSFIMKGARKKPVEMWDDLEPEREPAKEREKERPPVPSDRYAPPAFSGETELLFAEETEDAPQLYRLAEKKRIPITAFPFFIGSREGVDYDPGDRGVSRLHARLELRGGRYWIMDLNSTNGTALNGEELTPNEETELFHGDRVEIAGTLYEFRVFDRRGESC